MPAPILDGLADGVISRARAEAAQSWRAIFARAIEDWHWAVVGLGSVAATSTTLLFFSMLLTFGPEPPSRESLAALMNNLRRPAGTVILMATPIGHDQEATLMMSWCLNCHRNPAKYIRPRYQVFNMAWQPPADDPDLGERLVKEYKIASVAQLTSCSTCHR